jgi:hypothetical protein
LDCSDKSREVVNIASFLPVILAVGAICSKPQLIENPTVEDVYAMMQDKILKCKQCGQQFVFTVGEQEFYMQKGFQNEPARCGPCRRARKNRMLSTNSLSYSQHQSSGYFHKRKP